MDGKRRRELDVKMIRSQCLLIDGREARRRERNRTTEEFTRKVSCELDTIKRQRERRFYAPSISPNRVMIKQD
jgi:hypothetical protein